MPKFLLIEYHDDGEVADMEYVDDYISLLKEVEKSEFECSVYIECTHVYDILSKFFDERKI